MTSPRPMTGVGRILRWIFALPAGLIAAGLLMFPIHWMIVLFYYFAGRNPDAMIQKIGPDGLARSCNFITCFVPVESLERIVQAFVVPFITLLTVGRIVPSRKFEAVFALFVVYLLILGALFTRSASTGAYSGWGWLELAAAVLFGITGSILALHTVNSKRGESDASTGQGPQNEF